MAEKLLDGLEVALGRVENALACRVASLVHPLAAALALRDDPRALEALVPRAVQAVKLRLPVEDVALELVPEAGSTIGTVCTFPPFVKTVSRFCAWLKCRN